MRSILIIILLIGMTPLRAEEELTLNTEVTANGYNRFCKSGAKKIIGNLNKKSAAKIESVAEITSQIDAIKARKNLIDGLTKIKERYLESLGKFTEKEKASIDEFKSLLKGSLALSSVSMLVAKNPDNAKNITDLCKNNDTEPLCSFISVKDFLNTDEFKTLNRTLENFQISYEKVEDKNKLKDDIKIIYKSLDNDVSPDKILETLRKSPHFTQALAQNDEDSIVGCLNNNTESCSKLLKNSSPNNLQNLLNQEKNQAFQDINKEVLETFFASHNSTETSEKAFKKILKSEGEKAKKLIKSQVNHFQIKKELSSNYNQYCEEDSSAFNMEECQTTILALIEDLKIQEKENDDKLQQLNEELSKKLNADGSLEALEKLKKYVGDKFLRACESPDTKEIKSNLNCLPCLAMLGSGQSSNSQGNDPIESLGEKVSSIVGELNNNNVLSDKKGELGLFSKDELSQYAQYCSNTSLVEKDPTARAICADIYKERSRISQQKESKEWDDFNKKYWVEYNGTSKNGYEVYEKKSNARIFGEGLSQSINKIYPMWFSNFQLESQIGIMTNQALYQKQMMFMYSPTSPWMAAPYFQGTPYPTSALPTPGFNFTP